MQWWANEPIVFCRDGELESCRVRLMIAEKRACAVRLLEVGEETPEFLRELNPDAVYPFLACRGLVSYGPALDEFLHEYYPDPPLLPLDPVDRARWRLLTDQVRSWYRLSCMDLRGKFQELESAFDPMHTFFASDVITTLDMAISALLFDLPRIQYRLTPGAPFTGYVRMMLARPAFAVVQRPQLVMRPPDIIPIDHCA